MPVASEHRLVSRPPFTKRSKRSLGRKKYRSRGSCVRLRRDILLTRPAPLRDKHQEHDPMRIIKNTGSDRVFDELRRSLTPPSSLDLASPAFSLFAFAELRELLEKLDVCRIVLQAPSEGDLGLTGSETDRAFRNQLNIRWLARECAGWIKKKAELRGTPGPMPQSILIAGKPEADHHRVITGNCAFTTEGLGITPGNQFSLIQCSEKPEESAVLSAWFKSLWNTLPTSVHDRLEKRRISRLRPYRVPQTVHLENVFPAIPPRTGISLDQGQATAASRSSARCDRLDLHRQPPPSDPEACRHSEPADRSLFRSRRCHSRPFLWFRIDACGRTRTRSQLYRYGA